MTRYVDEAKCKGCGDCTTKCPKVEGLKLTFYLSIIKQKNNKYLLFSKLSV